MNQNQNTSSGFAIQNIILAESNFSRINNAVFEDVENNLNINVNVSVNAPTITVEETVDLTQSHKGNEQMKIRVKMVGIFQVVGESQIKDLESLAGLMVLPSFSLILGSILRTSHRKGEWVPFSFLL